jgi:hypothetical protein
MKHLMISANYFADYSVFLHRILEHRSPCGGQNRLQVKETVLLYRTELDSDSVNSTRFSSSVELICSFQVMNA